MAIILNDTDFESEKSFQLDQSTSNARVESRSLFKY